MAKNNNNTLLIVAGVGVAALVVYSLMNKNNQTVNQGAYNPAGGSGYSAGTAQNISAFGSLFSGLGSAFSSIWTSTHQTTAPATSAAISGVGTSTNTA